MSARVIGQSRVGLSESLSSALRHTSAVQPRHTGPLIQHRPARDPCHLPLGHAGRQLTAVCTLDSLILFSTVGSADPWSWDYPPVWVPSTSRSAVQSSWPAQQPCPSLFSGLPQFDSAFTPEMIACSSMVLNAMNGLTPVGFILQLCLFLNRQTVSPTAY